MNKSQLLSGKRGIYAISDCTNLDNKPLLDKTEKILETGIALFQYRNKDTDQNRKKELAKSLQSLCRQYQTPFIINDDVTLATELNADGVHLGKDDVDIKQARKVLSDKLIGLSCYNDLDLALEAEKNGADYVAFGAFFPTPSKPNALKANVDLLYQAKGKVKIPVIAIGGITPENGEPLVQAGANFLAVISGLYSSNDIINTVKAYQKLFNQ